MTCSLRIACWLFSGLACLQLVACSNGGAQGTYDVVILSGRVMDPETKFDGVRNVGIKDGRIATITEEESSGNEIIDAKGHVVAAGFIDTHHHGAGKSGASKRTYATASQHPLDLELGTINVDAWYAEREGKWAANYGAAASHEFHRIHGSSIRCPYRNLRMALTLHDCEMRLMRRTERRTGRLPGQRWIS